MSSLEQATPPDGIADEHAQPVAGWRRHASPLSLLIFGVVVALALLGVLGHERTWEADTNGVELTVHAPEIIRNGEFFEMRIDVASTQPVAELVVGIDSALWEDLTVNTMIPAAEEEESADGEFRFVFAELPAGSTFHLKADLQVNPDIVGGNEGVVTVYDAEEPRVEMPISILVLP